MLATNETALVKISVLGEIANPAMPGLPASPYFVSADGEPMLVPTFGGIVYNVKLGDRALGWAGELIQPGVSIKAGGNANTALGVFACLGNRARVVNGAASGATGVVTGKSGRFAEHVICHFDDAALEKMAPGDKVQVQAHGVGLQLADFPDIQFKSCSPALLEALNPDVNADGKLVVPVKGTVPSVLAGAGAGLGSENGALNLQTSDPQRFAEAGLDDLRFGDLVAVADWDSRYGHGYLRGAMAIGVVCQGGSFRSGYGPGIAVIMTSKAPVIEPVVTAGANIKELMRLG
ncbi:MAG: DUF4438 domain-containing protein [Caldilineaceae bacterium]|nr:DUF4438 domain-containing protein [Caldilinea sp.]MCB9117843.1 DUF4438 domain-containing protein [Caldilineaceae bacterium]MCB9121746.1 DUF4438 domain-containing protein [Caldilineaceae bacterium]